MAVNTMVYKQQELDAPVTVGNVVVTSVGLVVGGVLDAIIEPLTTIKDIKKMGAPWKKGFWKGIYVDEAARIRTFAREHSAEMQRERERLEREAKEWRAKHSK